MSREAQAAREKQARIILGQAELEIAHSFQEAAKSYHDNPTALHLRAMNMLGGTWQTFAAGCTLPQPGGGNGSGEIQ